MERASLQNRSRENRRRGPVWRDSALVAVAALAVYVATLAPSIGPGDSPELTTAAWLLGVTHPTGYPLYTLLGHAFARVVPVGSVAYRLNLFSAVAMALGVALVYLVARLVCRRRVPSLAAALLLAFTPGLWSQALIAEVYALHILLSMAVLLAGMRWDRRGERRWLYLTGFLFGLACTHHLMSLLMVPGLLYLAVTSRHRGMLLREMPRLLICTLTPLALYLYLPWAALRDGPANWGDPRTWDNFLAHVSGRQYRELMFSSPPAELLEHLQHYAAYLPGQFGLPGIVLGVLGLWRLARGRRRWFWGTLLLYGAGVGYALNYRISDVEVYYIASNCVFALWVSVGFAWALRALRVACGRRGMPAAARARMARRQAWIAAAALPAMLLWSHWGAVSQRDNWTPLEYGRGFLAALEPNAVLFAGGDVLYFPLLYTKYVEGRRPDVVMVNFNDAVAPERERLVSRWAEDGLIAVPPACGSAHRKRGEHPHCYLRKLLADNIGRRPVYFLGPRYVLEKPNMRETLAPYARLQATNFPGWRLYRTAPSLDARGRPAIPARITFGGAVRFAGYDTEPLRRGDVSIVRIRYYWDLLKPAPPGELRAWVMFTDEQGNYATDRDGEPRFHNTHPLGQGLPLPKAGFPRRICETFEVVVPPAEAQAPRRLRVALSAGERFLPAAEAPGERFVDAGSIGTRTLAAGSEVAPSRTDVIR